jgi:hypothetical protein
LFFILGVFVHTISATDLARNTRATLDQVASTGQAISVSRNQTVIAQIVQPQSLMTASQALDGLPTTPADFVNLPGLQLLALQTTKTKK